MLNSLGNKVILALVFVIVLGAVVSGLIVVLTIRYQMTGISSVEKQASIESLSLSLADEAEAGDRGQIEKTIASALVYENIAYVAVYDADNNELGSVIEQEVSVEDLDISRHTLKVEGVTVGRFEVGFDDSYINDLVTNTAIILVLVVTGFLLLTGLVFYFFIRQYILQPVRDFTETVDQINENNLSARVDIDSKDEIGFLARSFNTMTMNLEASQAALLQSHDELEMKVELRTQGERRRTEQLRTINETGRKISAFLSLDELLPYVVNSLRETFNYYNVNVFLMQESGESLDLRAGSGGYSGEIPVGFTTAYGEGIIGIAAEVRDFLMIPDITKDKRFIFSEELPDTRSELAVPIILGSEVLGVLDVQSDQVNAFDEIDIFTVQTIADQLAVAIQNAHYYRENREMAVITERNRMAREIHDTLAQGFTGIIMQLEAAEQAIDEKDYEGSAKHLQSARKLAGESLNEARRSVWALRPQLLENLSFIEALKAETEKFGNENGIPVLFSAPENGISFSPNAENALLRILQEALNNIKKHAKAGNVTVTLEEHETHGIMTIEDDGIGFDTEKDRKERFGLISMRERVRLLGGSLEIYSEEGHGTRLIVTMPAGKNNG